MPVKYYAYKLGHDYGFAPNPYWGTCTLANCKSTIRKGAKIGDWIIGTGSKKMGLEDRLIFIMQVTGKITFEDYWNSPEYEIKKPLLNGSLARIHGDNIYYKDGKGEYCQLPSLHSHPDDSLNVGHMKRDTGGKYVLLSHNFYYFGENHLLVPQLFKLVCSRVRNTELIKDQKLALEFINWIGSKYRPGIHGKPYNWIEYRQFEILELQQ